MKHPEGKNKDRRSKMSRRIVVLIAVAVLVLVVGIGLAYALAGAGVGQQEAAVNQPPPEPEPATEPPPPKGWKPIPIEVEPPPEEIPEVTVDEIRQKFRERMDEFEQLRAAEKIRVTGRLIAFDTRGLPFGITLAGEDPDHKLFVMGKDKSGQTLTLWETCPKGQNPRLVEREFRERVKLGDVLMVEGKLFRLNEMFSDIARVYVRK